MPVNYRSELPASADVVIVGGGVVGAATAFAAARAGLRPLLLERRQALCALTTAAATGAFRLQFEDRDEWALVRESVELLLNFAERTGQRAYDPAVRQQGYLWLTTDEAMAAFQRDLVTMQHGWGQTDVELLDGDEVRRRFPYIGPNVIQARFRAGDGLIDQKALTRVLQERRIAGAGLDVLEQEPPEPDDPILTLDNVILTPHALCWTDQCFAGNGAADVRAVLEVQHGRVPRGVVNREVLETDIWKRRLAGLASRFGAQEAPS